jgi:hypothetical protein
MSIYSTHADGTEVHIEPHDEAGVTAELAEELARHGAFRAHFGDDEVHVERVELLGKDPTRLLSKLSCITEGRVGVCA